MSTVRKVRVCKTVPLWASKRGVCFLPLLGEECLAPVVDSKGEGSSPGGHFFSHQIDPALAEDLGG